MIKLKCWCDVCGVRLVDGEDIACFDHVLDLQTEINTLKEKIEELERELDDAYEKIKETGI